MPIFSRKDSALVKEKCEQVERQKAAAKLALGGTSLGKNMGVKDEDAVAEVFVSLFIQPSKDKKDYKDFLSLTELGSISVQSSRQRWQGNKKKRHKGLRRKLWESRPPVARRWSLKFEDRGVWYTQTYREPRCDWHWCRCSGDSDSTEKSWDIDENAL